MRSRCEHVHAVVGHSTMAENLCIYNKTWNQSWHFPGIHHSSRWQCIAMVKITITRHHKSSMLWQMNRKSPITWFHFLMCNLSKEDTFFFISVENRICKLLMQQASIQLLFSALLVFLLFLFAYLLKWLCIAYFCFLLFASEATSHPFSCYLVSVLETLLNGLGSFFKHSLRFFASVTNACSSQPRKSRNIFWEIVIS